MIKNLGKVWLHYSPAHVALTEATWCHSAGGDHSFVSISGALVWKTGRLGSAGSVSQIRNMLHPSLAMSGWLDIFHGGSGLLE